MGYEIVIIAIMGMGILYLFSRLSEYETKKELRKAENAFLEQAQLIRNKNKKIEELENHLINYQNYIKETVGEVPKLF